MQRVIVTGLITAALVSGALAQSLPSQPAAPTPPATTSGIEKNQGLGSDPTKEQLSPAQSNAVGATGPQSAQTSMAPAMQLDCTKNPGDCSKPIAPSSSAQPPGMPQQSK
jgi:hypothetical protein